MRARIVLGATAMLLVVAGCAQAPRAVRNLNGDWRFIRRDVEHGERVGVDDSAWQRVTPPHTWNARDGQDGGKNYYRGACWYRRRVDISRDQIGKQLFLRFEGAATVAEVFVNGKQPGSHRGNFAAFCF